MNNNNNASTYEETFYIIPRYIRKLSGITLTFLDVYETIFQFWNKNKNCFLSEEALCERTNHKRTQIYEALKFFESHNELKRIKKGGKRYLIRPEKIIETDCTENVPMSAPADYNVRNSGHSTSGIPDHNIKNINKEINKKENITKEKLNPIIYQETLYQQNPIREQLSSQKPIGLEITDEEQKIFEYFWEAYPIKKNKKRAQLAWFSQGCHQHAEEILSKLCLQIDKDVHFKEGYLPNPENYIRDERWKDEIIEKTNKAKSEKPKLDMDSLDWINDNGVYA